MNTRTRLLIDYYIGGIAHAVLKPFVILLGRVLERDHRLDVPQDVTVVKLLGGGSLVVAYPALLAIRRHPNVRRMRLVASPAAKPFGELLGIFDEVILIRDNAPLALMVDSLRAFARLWRTDTLIDLEIHSRLTTIFCLLTFARNRIGFYTQESFWRRGISTHLLFCQLSEGIYHFYDQVAKILGAAPISFQECGQVLHAHLHLPPAAVPGAAPKRIAVAPCCSELGRERMMKIEEWIIVLRNHFPRIQPEEIHLLGSGADRPYLEALAAAVAAVWPAIRLTNHAGRSSLLESVNQLAAMDQLLAIDSSLLHVARLLGIRSVSYWGPTDPRTRLRPGIVPEEVHYARLPCSPCIHIAAKTPCGGNNLCMRFAVDPNHPADKNPIWLA